MVKGLGFRLWGSGFRVQGSGFGVQGLGFRVWGLVFRVKGLELRVEGLGSKVSGSENQRFMMSLWPLRTGSPACRTRVSISPGLSSFGDLVAHQHTRVSHEMINGWAEQRHSRVHLARSS